MGRVLLDVARAGMALLVMYGVTTVWGRHVEK